MSLCFDKNEVMKVIEDATRYNAQDYGLAKSKTGRWIDRDELLKNMTNLGDTGVLDEVML